MLSEEEHRDVLARAGHSQFSEWQSREVHSEFQAAPFDVSITLDSVCPEALAENNAQKCGEVRADDR